MKLVFLDRDGVINKYPGDADYIKDWSEFRFLPRVKSALKKLSDNGFKIFVVSNQAGVSKGEYSQGDLDLITKNMLKELGKAVKIAGVYYCTHREEENCSCRKPKTGLIEKAFTQLKLREKKTDFGSCYFIGDTRRDIETGKGAGLKTILVFSGKEKAGNNRADWQSQPDFTCQDLSEAIKIILDE